MMLAPGGYDAIGAHRSAQGLQPDGRSGTAQRQLAHAMEASSSRWRLAAETNRARNVSRALREHASRAGLAADEIVPVGDTVIVGPDPALVAA